MNNPGVTKEIDRLGRLVIPKEFRERYGLDNKVEVLAVEEGVLVRKPEYQLIKINTESNTDKYIH